MSQAKTTRPDPIGASGQLERGLGLWGATSLNMIDMVGVGPFITLPLVVAAMGGPQAMLGWIVGAVIALADGLVWAELGAAMPEAGGSYVYLREGFGRQGFGRMVSFLFIWQCLLSAPLSMASGCIGFAQYASYLLEWLTPPRQSLLAAAVALALTAILYRRISTLGKISVFLWMGVLVTMGWVIFGGLSHFDRKLAFTFPDGAFSLSHNFFFGLSSATLITLYDYLGYYNVCYLGGEIREPGKNIPRAILISVAVIAVLYLVMNISVVGAMPWQEVEKSPFIVSDLVERLYGRRAAGVATGLILWTALASVFSLLLGYSRIPYAAALDGGFFRVFGRIHPTKRFPVVSLLLMGGLTMFFSLFGTLQGVIKGLLALRILIQFEGQVVAVMLLRRRLAPMESGLPFRMWLYPLPALVALVGWLYAFWSLGSRIIALGVGFILLGAVAYLMRAATRREWPFAGEPRSDRGGRA